MAALPTHAQPITQATIVDIQDSDQVFIDDRKARIKESANLGEQVRTQQARAELRFNVGAGIRLGRNSAVVVGNGCIRLNRGKVLVAGKTGGDRGCLRSVVAATRGTVYIMELAETGEGRITVLEGTIDVSNAQQPDSKVITVSAGQAVNLTSVDDISSPFELSENQLNSVAAPLLEGFQQPLPDLQKISVRQQDRGFASTFLQEAVGRGDSGFDRSFNSQRGVESANFVPEDSFLGNFVRQTDRGGVFSADAGFSVPITINIEQRTLTFGEFSGVASSLGLSGNNAVGTVILNNGQAVRVEVFNVELREPEIDRLYPGRLSIGRVRDR